ncbi:NmrA family NAD(P)-binding protein [Oryzicola mucosus]|uniref:NmrA family NAD(P)-binding protein n=1 Tax=Oryzicola mucosus TaxID=2767425 RepID=A0A8J6PR32_9HYPH|nr:NmrA family NAD(P)-binding protein [Oryzicola mucosus]MBD0416640.1 NmrA family NAD(P)-binding protein [Oryzicola mucosus]
MAQAADILVTGASGHLGRAVLTHLLDTLKIPADRIVATSRKPEELENLRARGVELRKADFDDAASLAAAFAGVKRLLIISTDALDEPGKRLRQHQAAVKAAEAAGVAHIVYTSLPNAKTSLVSFAPDHAGTEAAIASSSIPGHTILGNTWYAENLLHSLPNALATGNWYTAAGDGGTSYITRNDLALAAAVAVASDFTGKRTLNLFGSKAYTVDEVAELARKAIGKPLQVVQVPVEGLIQGMIGAGLPEPVAHVYASFDTATKAGNLAGSPDDFKALTGKEPEPFEQWFSKTGAAALSA